MLACYDCNRAKSDFELPDPDHYKIYPDGEHICKTFFRDDNYYIKIQEEFLEDQSVLDFYDKLKLNSQTHRLDYLLMNMKGVREQVKDKPSAYQQLTDAIELLLKKRK